MPLNNFQHSNQTIFHVYFIEKNEMRPFFFFGLKFERLITYILLLKLYARILCREFYLIAREYKFSIL